jgi:hypothetical protein
MIINSYPIYLNGGTDNSSDIENVSIVEKDSVNMKMIGALEYPGYSKEVLNGQLETDLMGSGFQAAIIIDAPPQAPEFISKPENVTLALGDTGNNLTWVVYDNKNVEYHVWKNDTDISNSTDWDVDLPIIIDIDGLEIGTYNFTILVIDQAGDSINDTVFVEVIYDTTPPEIKAISDLIIYGVGDTGNIIQWNITDISPANYTVYQDNNAVENGTWKSGVLVNVTVDGLDIGYYNYTIYANDTTGNYQTDYVNVTVVDFLDTQPPIIIQHPDIEYEEGSTNNVIQWDASDTYNHTYEIYLNGSFQIDYEIYLNGSFQIDGNWSSQALINYTIDGLLFGYHNFTILVFDTSNNVAHDTVIVTVTDGIDPVVDNLTSRLLFEQGVVNTSLIWSANDTNPNRYYIYKNGSQVHTGGWQSNKNITYDISTLAAGVYNYTLLITDKSDNTAVSSITVEIIDTTKPIIFLAPTDIDYFHGTQGNTITWQFSDYNPDTYEVYQNGSWISGNIWTSRENINISIDNLEVGTYIYTIQVVDKFDNNATDSVTVVVLPLRQTLQPITPSDLASVVHEGDIDTIGGKWLTDESEGVQNAVINITLFTSSNQSLISVITTTLEDGTFEIVFDYSQIPVGTYHWEVHFESVGYVEKEITIPITVVAHKLNIELIIPEVLIQDETFVIHVKITYNDSDDTTLLQLAGLTSKTGGAEDIEVIITLNVEYNNGSIIDILKTVVTNSSGQADIILEPYETNSLVKLNSIDAKIEAGEFNDESKLELSDDDIRQIKIEGMKKGDPTDYSIYILIIFIFLAIIAIPVAIIFRVKEPEDDWSDVYSKITTSVSTGTKTAVTEIRTYPYATNIKKLPSNVKQKTRDGIHQLKTISYRKKFKKLVYSIRLIFTEEKIESTKVKFKGILPPEVLKFYYKIKSQLATSYKSLRKRK